MGCQPKIFGMELWRGAGELERAERPKPPNKKIRISRKALVGLEVFSIHVFFSWCQGKDSNLRRLLPADLQSALVDRLSTLACVVVNEFESPGRESDPRPPSYQEGVLPLNYLGMVGRHANRCTIVSYRTRDEKRNKKRKIVTDNLNHPA